MKSPVGHIIFIILISFSYIACQEKEDDLPQEPADLSMEVTVLDDGSGKITIVSIAKNATEYHFLLGSDEQLIEKNKSGSFNYSFTESGTYLIQIRAYGSSGRYVKKEAEVRVQVGDDTVSIEDGYSTPMEYDGYNLVWNDEFNENQINTNNWVFETGDGCPNLCGWGNNELQYYKKENAWTKSGVLTIEARNEVFGGKPYTSARMKTQEQQSFAYGRVDIRALLPEGQGIWPALWMLGENIPSAGWPDCGEIDIMEMIGGSGRENTVHGTVHYDNNGEYIYQGGHKTLSSGIFADKYHVFTIIWDVSSINWYVDDIKYYSVDITPAHMSEFHEAFFFIFNVAVGGNWPGSPNEKTVFPQQMKVDYVRVFQAG